MQSYTDLMPSGHQRSRIRAGLLQRTQAAAISAFGPDDAWEGTDAFWAGKQIGAARSIAEMQSQI
jgi:hypothetical protein